MKKAFLCTTVLLLILVMGLSGCGGNGNKETSPTNQPAASNNGSKATEGSETAKPPAQAEKVVFWTFVDAHQKFYESMAASWNESHPDKTIALEATTIPYDDMHTKLLVALQSGVGAPDLVDIEQSKFPNFMKGTPQLVSLNDIVEPELGNIVKSRVEIYSKDKTYYGIDYHVGATVMYYNKEMLDQAGINPDTIKTWADFETAGKQMLDKTGKPMITFEGNGNWSWWPAISQQGSDQVDENGNVTVDTPVNVKTMEFFQKMVKEGVAAVAPGAGHDTEEYFGYMDSGGAASVFMPFWFMNRFTDHIPDLKGKVIIRPMPAWVEGGNRSAGMGGTATSITNQAKNPDLIKEFLAYAKLSKEGNLQIWKQLGFDPIRTDVWSDPAMKESNKFTDYFGTDIFDTLLSVKDEIAPVHIREKSPEVFDAIRNKAMPQIFIDMKDPAKVLKEVQDSLK
ncbi:arabinose-binding protein [Paenibacillus sp. P3E]|uniref:ABC transporter substrate-binding protein n=1 Tax=unclassified Paenibacillus TaxID=185978 RepID=UPI00093AFE7E|nr:MULTISPECIES: sugar ABC transporter substrate-binding protein [unclassified Paenibacillus]OKP72283.1 arabinose-binding protein [Paenibacillus sp. P3E]OKP89718.1 arabinose-binding protein [Paenibacillus sp. P32E]